MSRTLELLKERWTDIQDRLIAEIDKDYDVFEGRTFKADRFEAFIVKHNIPWGRTETGRLELSDDVFRQAAKSYPILAPLRELRSSLSEMRLSNLAVGADGRNRCLLSPFGARSSRNQPSNTRFIFGPSVWLRGLIKPPPGYGVAYIDWCQQEFGIAAGLSGDEAMIAAYHSGDPYLAFAKQAGSVPEDATKESHGAERELFKTCVLGVQYGMGEDSLALRIDGMTPYPKAMAKYLLRSHRETYKKFWRWSDNATDHALLKGWIWTAFGWHVYTSQDPNPRFIRNFPMQANGAEMMRIAACLGTEAGIEICAPVHDAFLIAGPVDRLDHDIFRMRKIMAEASRIVCGFELRTDEPTEAGQIGKDGKPIKFPSVIRYPNRYMDKRGQVMWDRVMGLLKEFTSDEQRA